MEGFGGLRRIQIDEIRVDLLTWSGWQGETIWPSPGWPVGGIGLVVSTRDSERRRGACPLSRLSIAALVHAAEEVVRISRSITSFGAHPPRPFFLGLPRFNARGLRLGLTERSMGVLRLQPKAAGPTWDKSARRLPPSRRLPALLGLGSALPARVSSRHDGHSPLR